MYIILLWDVVFDLGHLINTVLLRMPNEAYNRITMDRSQRYARIAAAFDTNERV